MNSYNIRELVAEIERRKMLNVSLSGLTLQELEREVAKRNALQQEEHKATNLVAAKTALTALLDLAFHNPEVGCDDHDLLPMGQMVEQGDGFDKVACPACYLLHLAEADDNDCFDDVWLPDFMVQLKVADRPTDAVREREEHINLALSSVEELLGLTFHPSRTGCSDDRPIALREQFVPQARNRNRVSCVRCFLMDAMEDPETWKLRYQLQPLLFNVRPITTP